VVISKLWYQGHNRKNTNPMYIYAIRADGSKELIHKRIEFGYVPPVTNNPTGGIMVTLATPIRAVGFTFEGNGQNNLGAFSYPIEFKVYGSYTPVATPAYSYYPVRLGDMLGINFHQWDVQTNNPKNLDPQKWPLFTGSLTGGRLYVEGNVVEPKLGTFEWDHTNTGGWNFDMIFQGAKDAGIFMLPDIKNTPDTITNSYLINDRRAENVPRFYTPDTMHNGDPWRYAQGARAAHQFALRYGRNINYPDSLILVKPDVIFPQSANPLYRTKKKGLNTVWYVENENERDKNWFGRVAQQLPRENAANQSAFYDGHMGKMGPGYGVKTADSTMKVVMNGIAGAYPYFVQMIDWCEKYRGRLPDGTVNICWDPIVNIHQYSNNVGGQQWVDGGNQRSICPDMEDSTDAGANIEMLERIIADEVARGRIHNHEIWITECGLDYLNCSPLHVEAIPGYSVDETVAILSERTWGYYGAKGVTKIMNYQYGSEKPTECKQYNTMPYFNLLSGTPSRKAVADYSAQVKNHWANYYFNNWLVKSKTLHVQRWNNGTADVYRMVIPLEKGETGTYTLSLPGKTSVTVYTPRVGATTMAQTTITGSGSFVIPVSNRTVYVQAN